MRNSAHPRIVVQLDHSKPYDNMRASKDTSVGVYTNPAPQWFQWEFLRRNDEYRRDFAQFDAQFGAWFKENGYWWAKTGPAYSREARFFLSSVIGPAAKSICSRWEISDPYNPEWTFDARGMRVENGSRVRLPVFGKGADALGIWNFKEPDPTLFPTDEDRIDEMLTDIFKRIEDGPSPVANDLALIRLQLDIRMPLDVLLDKVKTEIEVEKARYEAEVEPLPDQHRMPRKRLDRYETYLKVWQFRKEKGWTFERIAREVFPKEMRGADRFSPTIKRVRTQYKRACELIDGDYRQIGR